MDPLIGGALISGFGSLLGGLFSNSSSAEEAQKNREFQERMLEKQMNYASMQWEQDARYNSASAQRKRLEQAGLNPYLMMSGGSAGTASSVSPGSAPSGSMASFQNPAAGLPAGFSQALSSISQSKLNQSQQNVLNSQAGLNEIEARTKQRANEAEILLKLSQSGLISEQKARQVIENQFLPEQMAANVKGTKANIRKMESEAKLSDSMRYMNEAQLPFIPQKIQAELLQMASNVSLNNANIKKISEDINYIVWSRMTDIEKQTGRKMTDAERNALFTWLMNYKQYESQRMFHNSGYDNPFMWYQKNLDDSQLRVLMNLEYGSDKLRSLIPFTRK